MRREKEIEIRWRDLDGFGHVNNAVFGTYLEECRDRFIEQFAGAAVDRFVIRRLELDYLSQVRQADGTVRVTVELDGVGATSVRTREEVRAGSDGRLAVRSACVIVYLDAEFVRPAPLPPKLRAALEATA